MQAAPPVACETVCLGSIMNKYVQPDLVLRIRKRDGREEVFNTKKITRAILRAGEATGEFGMDEAQRLTIKVMTLVH